MWTAVPWVFSPRTSSVGKAGIHLPRCSCRLPRDGPRVSRGSVQYCCRYAVTPLLCRVHHRGRARRQKTVQHLPRTFAEPDVVLAVEHPDAVDEYAVHADRIAQRARAAAGQVVDPAWRRYADRCGIEQQQIGIGAPLNAAAVADAVKPGLMAGQPAHAFRDVERSALTHPMTKEIKPKAGIAQIDQMRAPHRTAR